MTNGTPASIPFTDYLMILVPSTSEVIDVRAKTASEVNFIFCYLFICASFFISYLLSQILSFINTAFIGIIITISYIFI